MSLLDVGERRTEVIATTRKRSLWGQESFPQWWACYVEKLEGANEAADEGEGLLHACSSFFGCFLCISLLGMIQEYFLPALSDAYEVRLVLLTASWGAATIHVICNWFAPCAQPKNVILGNLLGALAACGTSLLPLARPLKEAMAVAATVGLQELLGAVHPAGAANALLLADAAHLRWHGLGLSMAGSLLLVSVGVVFNNLCADRFYPQAWWPPSQPEDQPAGRRLPPPASYLMHAPEQWLQVYWQKLQGGSALGASSVSMAHVCFSSLASFIFMLAMALLNEMLHFEPGMLAWAAVATSSVLSDWHGSSSQPLNCLLGSCLAALCASLLQVPLPWAPPWLPVALVLGLTSSFMELLGAVFPAAGAIAMAQQAWPQLIYLGIVGPCLLVISATVLNNLQETRLYPRRWPGAVGQPKQASYGQQIRRPSERNLVRRWTDEAGPGMQYSKIYVGVLTVGLQCFFLMFLFFAKVDESRESLQVMCESLAWLSMALLVGFSYTNSFLKAYGLGAVGYSLLIVCVAVQWDMILESLLKGEALHFGYESLMRGYAAAAAVLVSFGSLIGKVDALQILLLVLLEMPCFCWTKLVFLQLGSAKPIVHDKGGLLIFLFGTAFGVAAGRVLGAAEMAWLNGSQRSSELLSLLGSACLWISLPSLAQHRSWQHTVLALLGSSVATFAVAPLLHEGRLEPGAVRSAPLAGGVATIGIADLLTPFQAMAVGCAAGAVSTCGLAWCVNRELDTAGALSVYGLPSLLGGLVSLLLPDLEVPKGNQALGLLGATLSGALAGSLCGHLLRSLRPSVDLAFSDEVRWACSEDLPRGVLSL